jgi:hypothetical protein
VVAGGYTRLQVVVSSCKWLQWLQVIAGGCK